MPCEASSDCLLHLWSLLSPRKRCMGAVWFLEATTSWAHAGMTLSHACVRKHGGSTYYILQSCQKTYIKMHCRLACMQTYNLLHRITSRGFAPSTLIIFWESMKCWNQTQQPDRLCVLPLICLEIYGLCSSARRCTPSAFNRTRIELRKRKERRSGGIVKFVFSEPWRKREEKESR